MDFKKFSSIYEKSLKLLLIFLIIFIPYREVLSQFISSKVKILPDLMVLATFCLYIIKNKFRIKLNLTDLCYIGFLLVAFVSTVFINKVGIKPYIVEARSIVLYYIVYFMIRNSKLTYKFYQVFARVMIYNTMIIALASFVERITNKDILFPTAWANSIFYIDNFLRTYGVFNNPNTYGAYLLFSTITVFYLHRVLNIKVNRLFYMFSIVGIILTASRSSMIALGVFIVIAALVTDTKAVVKSFAINIAASVAIVFIINNISVHYSSIIASINSKAKTKVSSNLQSSAIDRFNELSSANIISKSKTDGRIFSVLKGIEIFKENPVLGTGFGTYGDAASLIITPKQYEKYEINKGFYADNEYIKVLVETGTLGTLIYLLFLLSIMYNCRHNKLKITSCVILGFLGLFYNIFEVQILSFLFWIVLTLPEPEGERLTIPDRFN